MSVAKYVPYTTFFGAELVINEITGESFATQAGYCRISGVAASTISMRMKGLQKIEPLKEIQLQTSSGIQTVKLIPENIIGRWLAKDRPELHDRIVVAGVRVYLHTQAGFKISSTATQQNQSESLEDLALSSILNFNKDELTVPQQIKLLDLILQYLKIGHDSMAYAIAQALGIRLVAEASDNVALTARVSNEIRQCTKQEIEPPEILTNYVQQTKKSVAALPEKQIVKSNQLILTTAELYFHATGLKSTPSTSGKLFIKLKRNGINPDTINDRGKHAYVVTPEMIEIAREITRT